MGGGRTVRPVVRFRPLPEEEERLIQDVPPELVTSAFRQALVDDALARALAEASATQQARDDAMSRAIKIMCGSRDPLVSIPRPVALLLADLLDWASEEFSRHGCNDYTFPAEAEPAREAILRAYAAWNGSPDVPAHPSDWSLMAVGAAILRNPVILEAGR